MAKENFINSESINRRSSFLRPLVDKIRTIDAKWFFAGVIAGGIILGLSVSNQALSIGAFGVAIVATGLLICTTDIFDIAPKH